MMNIPRKILIFNFFIGALLAGVSFKYNVINSIPLCPLCLIQVIIFYVIALVSLILFVDLPKSGGRVGYSIFVMVSSLLGAAAAFRQIWMSNLADKNLFACSPDTLSYLLKFQFVQLLRSFTGIYNNCALQNWKLIGLSMPMWSLIFLGLLFGTGLIMYFHKNDAFQEISSI